MSDNEDDPTILNNDEIEEIEEDDIDVEINALEELAGNPAENIYFENYFNINIPVGTNEIPEELTEKNSFFNQDKNEIDDFEFNQDIEFNDDDNIRSPGWIRYQKKLK